MNAVNHLPQGWEYKKMPEVVKWGSGGTPKATESLYYENGTIPWLIIGDLNDGIVKTSATKITKLGLENSSAKLIPCGTLLIAMYGSIGKLGITGFECCTNQAIAFAQKLNGVDTMYLFYYLMMIKPKLIQMGKGGTQKNISQTVLNSLQIPLPPLATQHLIVTRIESLFAELDKGVEHLRTAQQQIKTYRQAVLNHWLNNDDGKWEMVKLKDICISISDGDHLPPKRTNKGIPFITISDIKGNNIDFSNVSYMTEDYFENLSENRKAKIGDILYTVTGSFGIPVMVEDNKKFCFQRHIGLVRPNPNLVWQKWLYYMMQSPIIYSQANEKSTGTAQKTVTLTVLRDFDLFLPPLSEQQRIVVEIESRLLQAEAVAASIENALQQAEALRQSILKKAFSGELVVSTSSTNTFPQSSTTSKGG